MNHSRQWIRYEDGVYEPVRIGGNLLQKKRGGDIPQWWVMDMPRNWVPQQNGYTATKNHPSGPLRARLEQEKNQP